MFPPAAMTSAGGFRGATAPQHTSVQGRGGLGRRCPGRADRGASREALQGKALEHRHWGQGWKSNRPSVPGRRGLTKCREPGEVGGNRCFILWASSSHQQRANSERRRERRGPGWRPSAGSWQPPRAAQRRRPAGSWTRCCGAGGRGGRTAIGEQLSASANRR